jgi:hypothetical protein
MVALVVSLCRIQEAFEEVLLIIVIIITFVKISYQLTKSKSSLFNGCHISLSSCFLPKFLQGNQLSMKVDITVFSSPLPKLNLAVQSFPISLRTVLLETPAFELFLELCLPVEC